MTFDKGIRTASVHKYSPTSRNVCSVCFAPADHPNHAVGSVRQTFRSGEDRHEFDPGYGDYRLCRICGEHPTAPQHWSEAVRKADEKENTMTDEKPKRAADGAMLTGTARLTVTPPHDATAAELIAERRAQGLTAADLPRSPAVYANRDPSIQELIAEGLASLNGWPGRGDKFVVAAAVILAEHDETVRGTP